MGAKSAAYVGQVLRVGSWSYGTVVWVGSGDWRGFCSVRWSDGGVTLEVSS